MGTFHTAGRIRHIVDRQVSAEIDNLLVDTGREYTWISRDVLERLGIQPEKKDLAFVMANGSQITRNVGFAIIDVADRFTIDEVVFAEEGICCCWERARWEG